MASSPSSTTILLVLLSSASLFSLLTTLAFAADILHAGQWLGFGQSLVQGPYLFTMQEDCNLILYDKNKVIWATRTNGRGSGCILMLQTDGNLVIRSNTRSVIWASNSNGQKGDYYLILQSDCNVVIYDSSKNPIWTTGTKIAKAAVVVIPHSNDTTMESSAVQNKVKELYP